MTKRIWAITFLILLFCAATVSAVNFPNPTSDVYIGDFANVLDREVEEHVRNVAYQIHQQTTAQIAVVTVQSLEGLDIENYSIQLARQWGIGSSDKNNGVLLLIAVQDRKSRIEVGRGLEGALPDGKTGRIQDDYLLPYLRQNDYSSGIKNTFDAIATEVCKEYNMKVPDGVLATPAEEDDSDWIYIAIIGGIITVLIIASSAGKNKGGGYHSGGGYYGGYRGRGGRGGSGGFGGFGGGGFSGGGSSRGW